MYIYLIGCKDVDYKTKKLCTILAKPRAYVTRFDGESKWIYILIEDDELFKKFNDNWNKDNNSIKKEFAGAPIYDKKFLKTKINSYSDETVDFHVRKIPEIGSNYIC